MTIMQLHKYIFKRLFYTVQSPDYTAFNRGTGGISICVQHYISFKNITLPAANPLETRGWRTYREGELAFCVYSF